MKKILLAIIAVAAALGPSHAQQTTKDQLIGSWKVLNLKATTGEKVPPIPSGNEWGVT